MIGWDLGDQTLENGGQIGSSIHHLCVSARAALGWVTFPASVYK